MTRKQCLWLGALAIGLVAWIVLPAKSPAPPALPGLLSFSRGQRIALGAVPAGRADVSFDISNSGPDLVQIDKISGSCNCMDIQLDSMHLNPGDSTRCAVTINVHPGTTQSSSIMIETREPCKERYFIAITANGIQEDTLEVAFLSMVDILLPDEQACLEMKCDLAVDRAPPQGARGPLDPSRCARSFLGLAP